MSYFVSKIGHLDPRFYSLIYCAIPGVQMSGSRCPTLFPKLDIWTPVSTVLCTVIPGVQMSGVQMSGVQMSGVQMSGVQMSGVQMSDSHDMRFINNIYFNNFKAISKTLNSIYGCIMKSIQTVIITSYNSIVLKTASNKYYNFLTTSIKKVRKLCPLSLSE